MDSSGYLQVLADNPELFLDEKDLPLIQDNKAMLDETMSNSITLYGTDIQKKMAELSQMMINNLAEAKVGEISEVIDQTIGYLSSVDEEEEDKKILFWKKKAKSVSLENKYDTISANVDKIENILEQHQVRLIKDCALLDQVYNMNQEYYKQVNIKIAAAKEKIKELELKLTDPDSDVFLRDIIDRIERKIGELEVSRTISLQQAPQIRLLQSNSSAMADKLQSTLYNVIPLWKNQIVLAFGAEHTREAIKADKQLTDMTNKLLIKNAQNLKMVSIETQRARNDNNIDVKALEQTNKILLESLDEIARIQEEGRVKRNQAELELVRIDEEMKTGLMVAASRSN